MSNDKYQYVMKWLGELATEQEQIIKSNLGAKYKLMLLMTYIDIFSQVWDMFSLESHPKQKDRFKIWIDTFLIDSLDGPVTPDQIYSIRNSLLHFAALPNTEKPMFISENSKSEVLAKNSEINGLDNALFLIPSELHSKFILAAIKTLDALISLEESDNRLFTSGIDRIHQKLKSESAFAIPEKHS